MKNILRYIAAVLLIFAAMTNSADAQFVQGQVLTAAQLNSALAAPAITGGTITGLSAPIPLASGGTGANTATGATSQLQYLQGATGSVARSLTNKFQDVVSIKDFGAICDGSTDDTVAIQAALNAGAQAAFVPQGACVASNLTMPATVGFVLYGTGTGSVLKQKGDGNPLLKWSQTSIFYQQGYVRHLAFDGTNGANNTVDTTGVGGETFENLYFKNTPTGYSSLYINGAASTYTHDIRLKDIQVYSSLAGVAGIRFGPLTSDTSLENFIMNGNFAVQYGLYYDVGATTIRVSNSHPYNAANNVVLLNGSNNLLGFDNVTFDNAHQDIFKASSSSSVSFSNCYFEAVPSGYYGVNLTSTSGFSFYNSIFQGASGSLAAVKDDSGSNTTLIVGGSVPSIGNFTTPFSLAGTNSYAIGLAGFNPLNSKLFLNGATATVQVQNTTAYLGANAAQAAVNNTAWLAPNNGIVTNAYVAVDATPAAGQIFTFTVYHGVTALGTITINNGSFSGSIAINTSVSQYDQLYIKSVFSATSGSANVRYLIGFTQ